MSSPCNREKQRLFLALWPEAVVRLQIAELASSVAGVRRVGEDNLHLTLVFLGATRSESLAAYQAALTNLQVPVFELVLDRYGHWPKPRILWLGCSQTPPELYALVADLHRRLRDCGFIPERRPFQAHVTLARKFSGSLPAHSPSPPVCWPISTVSLVKSLPAVNGSQYQILHRWPGLG